MTDLKKAGSDRLSRRKVFIEQESAWRCISQLSLAGHAPALAIGRWSDERNGRYEVSAGSLPDHHVVDVLLANTILDCYSDGRRIASGAFRFGGTQVTAPGEQVSCQFTRCAEAIHLFISQDLLESTYEDLTQSGCPRDFRLNDPRFAGDHATGRLALALSDAGTLEGPYGALCLDSLSTALIVRLMASQANGLPGRSKQHGLPLWRLRRAIDFIDANLARSITLQDIAQSCGLSRMHFAALFKVSTGSTPHSYLLFRRVRRARHLLSTSNQAIVDIALEVGFGSQAHFSQVFRQVTGVTPRAWRKQACGSLALAQDA
jgi:AraC family transcriptional regulator